MIHGLGISTGGNTTGTSGTQIGTYVLQGGNNITLSQITGGSGTHTLRMDAPAILSYFENPVRGISSTDNMANGTVYFQPFFVTYPVSMYRMNLLQQMTSQGTTTMSISASVSAGNASSGSGSFGQSGTVLLYSRVSTGTNINSSNIVSFYSNSYSYSVGLSASVSWTTNASSATVSFSTQGNAGFVSSIGSDGGLTTGSFSSSSSNTFSSTSAALGSFSSSTAMSYASRIGSQVRPLMIPMATSLSPGEYWLAMIQSTNTGSTNMSLNRCCRLSGGIVFFTSNTTAYAEIGTSVTAESSNNIPGWGSYSASSQTSTTIPISQISNQSNQQTWFNMMAAVK